MVSSTWLKSHTSATRSEHSKCTTKRLSRIVSMMQAVVEHDDIEVFAEGQTLEVRYVARQPNPVPLSIHLL